MAQGDAADSRAAGSARRRLNAPIIRKRKVRYQAPSVSEGIRHIIEGAPTGTIRSASYSREASRGLSPNETWGRDLGAALFSHKEEKAWQTKVESFKRKQELRKSIISLPDPDDLRARVMRRKDRARARKRGRLYTTQTAGIGSNEGLG